MILCDTNILVEFYKNNSDIIQQLQTIGSTSIAISTITRAELYYGAINKNELNQIKKHLDLISNIPLDQAISSQFVGLMLDYSLSHKLTIPDAIIAATAITQNFELYTLNIRDFRFIQDLKLYQIAP
ncbi:MAG: type II toxin-antitoxin system VapC family toxin [Synechococcaceae cyanobacterium RL_1_2]|nr:type II toxin-antitoxin system VapC family toxin [Synechococcaceae cyanobacterium RL_1_2]